MRLVQSLVKSLSPSLVAKFIEDKVVVPLGNFWNDLEFWNDTETWED